jgi:GH24 family phage-related lysozyme (muramidase)
MAQQANRFGLDEVRTQLAAPLDNFVTQGPLDTRLTTNTRSAGINSFTKALSQLAEKEQAKKIHNDIIDAQLASAYNKEQPKGLEAEAVFAFNKSEDAKLGLTTRQNLLNYATIEAAEILSSDLSRKEKLSQITLGMQSIVNIGKQGISSANAAAMFPLIEADFHKYTGLASAELAKQKKEEESSINAQAIESIIDGEYSQIATLLTDTIAGKDTISEDDDASPEEYATILNNVQNGLASKGFSIKKFNDIQRHILQTGRGAGVKETQLTILHAMMSRLLKAAQEGDALVNPKIITNLINGLKGNPNVKGSKRPSLRAEISGNTAYGKDFKELEDNFRKQLKTILSNKRTLKDNATKDRDNAIASTIFDAPEGTYTQEQGEQILKGLTDVTKQIAFTKQWVKQFSAESQNSSTSSAYINALITSSNVLTPDDKEIDEVAFAIHVNEYNLKPEAAKALRKVIDPRSKAANHRKRVLENATVMKLRESFRPTVKAYLKNLGMKELVSEYFKDGKSVPTPIVLAGIAKKFGAQSVVYNKASQILNAELEFTKELEGLIIANPDKEAEELALIAEAKYNNLFKDVITGKTPGSTEDEEQKAIIEERLAKSGKTIGGEPSAASGAVTTTTTTPTQEKAKIEQEKKIAIAKVLADTKDPDTFAEYVELATKEFEYEKQIVEDNHKLTGVTPATRGEKMRLVLKYGGTPTGRDSDIGVSERAVAAIATNPEVGLILRAKALQTAEKKLKEKLSKNVFTFRTPKEIQKNIDEGKNLFTMGNFQFTTDDLKGLTLKNTIEFPGNVAFYFKRLIDDIRVFRGTNQPLRPKIDIPNYEEQIPQESTKEKEEVSNIGKAKESILKALSPKEAEGATTSQDADFDPKAEGSRGFTGPASKTLAAKPEGAKGATGIYPEYGDQFTGGTSEESDIEGFTGKEVDMPPIVMDEIVVSEKAKPSILSGLPKETQEDIKRQLGASYYQSNFFTKEHSLVRKDLKQEVKANIKSFTKIIGQSNKPTLTKHLEILTQIEDGGNSTDKTKFVHRDGDKPNIFTAMYGVTTTTANNVFKKLNSPLTFQKGDKITKDQAAVVVEFIRKEALADLEKATKGPNSIKLSEEQKEVLVLLSHNLGLLSIHTPEALKALKRGDLQAAKIEFFSRAKGPNKVNKKFNEGLFKKNNTLLGLFERFGK